MNPIKKLPRNIRTGHVLKQLRKIFNLPQSQMAKELGISKTQISNLETGAKGIGPNLRSRFAIFFKVAEEEFNRMLLSDANEKRLRLSLAIYQTDISEIADTFLDLLELNRLAKENKLSEEIWNHLRNQISILYRLSQAAEGSGARSQE